ncbi:MAG: methyltransferase domain-containing protein [Gammaproteobacteria bacterium]|nr:methyltransferase domain-containing protein [Gammaproteobacteria bacterium]
MCKVCMPINNEAASADQFADQLLDMLNQGAMSLMVSIGHRTGLFDCMAELSTTGHEQIAAHAGLEPRYVKEWLAAMVTGGIVKYQPEQQAYELPKTHAALLTRNAAPDNIAVFAQYISILGQVEDKIVDCFRNGGGVAYEHYPRFHKVMAEDSGQTVLAGLNDYILPLIKPVIPQLETGISVLDVGCGKAKVLLYLASSYPQSQFTGYELSADALAEASEQAEKMALKNIQFIQRDLTDFESTAEIEQFDLVTAFDAIHDQAAPQSVLNGIYKTLKHNGTFLMQDIRASSHLENNLQHPIAPLLYTLSTMHCMTVSLAQDGEGLGTMWGEELAVKMLQTAGFNEIEINQLDHDFQNNFYVMQKKEH